MFFNDLYKFKDNIALIDADSGISISYSELDKQINIIADKFSNHKELVFLESKNTIKSAVCYLACLRKNKVVYLADNLTSEQSKGLIKSYKPNMLINGLGEIEHRSDAIYDLHPDLVLLLSTSGTTGTPKFVKLSASNIQANAESIVEYLKLTEDDIALAHLKLHYSYGLSILHTHLQAGACTVFSQYSILLAGFWNEMLDYSATGFAGVPYTFEALLKTDFDFNNFPKLRYVTQAGGKLEGFLVRDYALRAVANNVEFFVMYGQTEASPRISYLPPHLTVDYPSTIGKAIPNGKLFIIDEEGREIDELDKHGELAYEGPNVMMGYARSNQDLALDETPSRLLTGDIAYRTQHDFFYLVGRTKRFVKLFGLRINLDDVQGFVKKLYPQSAVTGDDSGIVVALELNHKLDKNDSDAMLIKLSEAYSLPRNKFALITFKSLPLLANGKCDFLTIMTQAHNKPKPSFLQRAFNSINEILELNSKEWDSIACLYIDALSLTTIDLSRNFNELNSDSLSFVYLTVELEQCLGDKLPIHWQNCSIDELELIYTSVRFNN